MKPNLAALLRDGLLHLRSGGTLRSYLARPELSEVSLQLRSELTSLLETAATAALLRDLPVPVPRAASSNRARFLSTAARLSETTPAWRWPLRWSLWPRFLRLAVAVGIVLALLLGAGTGVVNVAAASLPGSALYPVKLAVEDARLMLTPGDVRRAELYLRYANERTGEMLQLCAAGKPVGQAVVDRFSLQLERAVSAATSVAHSSEPGLAVGILEQVIHSTAAQHQALSQACVAAPETAQPALQAGAAAAQQTGQAAQQELAQLIAVLPTPTALAELPTPTPTRRVAEPTATPVPPTAVEPTQAPPPQPEPSALPVVDSSPTAAPIATQTPQRSASPTLPSVPSATVPAPGATRTAVNVTQAPLPSATLPTPEVTRPVPDVTATPAPAASRFRVELNDESDPVPASFRIRYTACVVNEGEVPLSNALVRITWTPRQCAYVPPDNPSELVFTIGTVGPSSRPCVSFSLNTSVICGGSQVVAEAVAACDQGSARDSETTTLALPPTPTPTVTRTPVVLFSLTMRDQPDPVIAGNALHLELCVVNHGDAALSNIVLEDVWSPRDCVYLPPDNPLKARWTWKSLAAHSEHCVSLTLNSYSICEGSLVSNNATMTCDQGTALAEELTTVVRLPASTPTRTPTATLTEPFVTPTPPATTVETTGIFSTAMPSSTENASPRIAAH